MGQRILAVGRTGVAAAVLLLAAGCDRTAPAPVRAGTIVSLSPAATDLLLAMNLRDRLVAVSAYDRDPRVEGKLPVAGDYLKIDWERITSLRPQYLIVQGRADRLPPGLRERAAEAGCEVVNIQIDRLDDVYKAIARLGDGLGAPAAANELSRSLRARMPPRRGGTPTALIVIGESGVNVVGRNNYLDDLLAAAGGTNVIKAEGYMRLDHEQAKTLSPDYVFVLLPGERDAVVEKATANVLNNLSLGGTPGRVIPITDADALLPASNVSRMASLFAEKLHGAKP